MINKLKNIVPVSIKNKIRIFRAKGDKHLCPFCNFNGKDLVLMGSDTPVILEKEIVGSGLRNSGCHKCGSLDRERLIYIYLKNYMNIFSEIDMLKILHLAPEIRISKAIHDFGVHEYICGDLFTDGYNYPEYVVKMNVLDIPFEDNYFDVIICNHLLEHVVEDFDAMKELHRVLGKNGKAILQVPISKNSPETYEDVSIIDPKQREIAYGQFDHVRIYGQDYSKRLNSVGFNVERINISTKYSQYGLNNDEDIFVVSK